MTDISRRAFALGAAVLPSPTFLQTGAQAATTPAEARAIAKEAFIYGYPMVDGYRIQHAYFVDKGNPEYKGPWNQIHSTARVFTPDDKTVQTPNSDTPYSYLAWVPTCGPSPSSSPCQRSRKSATTRYRVPP